MSTPESHKHTDYSVYRLPEGHVTVEELRAEPEFMRARSCLIMGHPGHCLRVHGWMEAARPICQILTDGSGHHGVPRIESSRKTIERAGAKTGALFGRYTDTQIYSAILHGDHALFKAIVAELAVLLVEERIQYVVGDAAEGYSTTHDMARLVIDAAVKRAEHIVGRTIPQYDFVLAATPDACPDHLTEGATFIELSENALDAKLDAGANYPELAHEVTDALAQFGRDAFRIECMRPVGKDGAAWAPDLEHSKPPYYEEYGEKQVAAGKYAAIIRYAEHMAPLGLELQQEGLAP